MSTEQRVAIVESDESEAILIGRILTDAGFDVQYADGMKTGLKLIAEWKPQVVISAPYLKQGTGIELCQALQGNAEHSGVYTILHASCGSRALAEAALEAMADDFFETQAVHTDLVPRVRVGFRIWRMHEKLRNAALTDALTGLFNHGHFHTRLESEIARARRYGHPVALIVLDIDFFKAINDTHGHLAGNIVLQEVANILRNCARDADVIGRIGGEEFAIIAPETSAGTAQQLAERIRHAMPIGIRDALPQQASPVTASFGVADSECAGVNNATTLMDIADRALYAAKRGGRNRVKLGNELDPSNELEAHVENNEFEWLRRRLSVLTARVQDVYVQSVATLLKALDEKDPYAARHS
ncbi:MAG: GGDEF domain-containing response regulator, partial [Phycisphaerae bacterium]